MDVGMISDNQAEATLIATLVYHPDFILHSDYLKAGYFYNVENGCIYWAIQELYKNGVETIDALNISNMLNSNGPVKRKIEEYNLTNIQEFINMAQYAARHSLEEYKLLVNTVVETSFKRELAKISSEIQADCFNSNIGLAKLNSLVNDKLSSLTQKYLVTNEIDILGKHVDELWQEIIDRRGENGVSGLPSKFSTLNEYFTYEPGELVLLCAKMKRGKSAMMMNEAIHKLKSGIPTLYLDSEMSDRLFYERMLANLSKVEVKKIKNGTYSYDEEQRLAKANDFIKQAPFVHMYLPKPTDEEIYSIHKILKYKINLGFSIYDYIKGDLTDSSQLYNYLGARCNFLKNNIAGDLNIPVLAGAQLNRNSEIADSIKLLQYCSVAAYWREKTTDELRQDGLECGNYCLNIKLNRLGEQMSEDEYLDFKFDGNIMTISEAKKHTHETTPFDK